MENLPLVLCLLYSICDIFAILIAGIRIWSDVFSHRTEKVLHCGSRCSCSWVTKSCSLESYRLPLFLEAAATNWRSEEAAMYGPYLKTPKFWHLESFYWKPENNPNPILLEQTPCIQPKQRTWKRWTRWWSTSPPCEPRQEISTRATSSEKAASERCTRYSRSNQACSVEFLNWQMLSD